jgi:hypothetical protein
MQTWIVRVPCELFHGAGVTSQRCHRFLGGDVKYAGRLIARSGSLKTIVLGTSRTREEMPYNKRVIVVEADVEDGVLVSLERRSRYCYNIVRQ